MAYAVLASLFTTTEKMLNPYPFSIPCKRETIESLHNNVAILLSFLENTPPHSYQTIMSLVTKIRDVAYETEDIIESHIAKHCRSIYESNGTDEDDETDETDEDDETDGDHETNENDEDDETNENDEDDEAYDNIKNMLSQALEDVMKRFESLKEDTKEIQGTGNFGGLLVEQMTSLSVAAGSSRPASSGKNKFVLLDMDLMNQIKEQLGSQECRLKVIPIVGMGGIGKTTLAKALIDDPFTADRFDIRAWVTISQQYSIQDVVENLVKDIRVDLKKKIDTGVVDLNAENDVPEHQGGSREQLHKILFGRRYVVVLDDLWDIDACDELQRLFPDWNNGSRIMVTTRQSGVATYAAKSYHEMKLLNDDMSWDLLRQELFAKDRNNCPTELVEIGKEIAKKCRGLPLTISVIGGLLSKEKMTREHWEHVAINIKSVLTDNDDQCSEILSLSYNYLPHHLKACFLYLGIFREDFKIPVSKLLQLWVAEGFLKPGSTNMEKVAEENLKDLIERNLIMVEKLKYNGKPKSCRIHDLLRDLCIREARKEKFLYVWNEDMDFNPEEANGQRRLIIYPECIDDEYNVMDSMPGNRTLICHAYHDYESQIKFGFELIRVLQPPNQYEELLEEVRELPNLRWLKVTYFGPHSSYFISKSWNLQYIISLAYSGSLLPSKIWNMPQLRHLEVVDHSLPPFPARTKEMPGCVLKHLEVLSVIDNFKCGDRVLERIPNLRKLKIHYDDEDKASDWSYYRLKNLVNLSKLETLSCEFDGISTKTLVANLAFPISLKKLSLSGCEISWDHMEIIGVLPNLEILKLNNAFVGPTWITIEDNFKKLEYLMISSDDLNEWIVEDANHFPSLRHLVLQWCKKLEEIPSCIGEISTLEIIVLDEYCSDGVVFSAKNIQDEYNNDLKLVINNISRDAYDEDDDDE